MLSRRVQVSNFGTKDSTRVNLIYSMARSLAHPINYKGNPYQKPGIACGLSWVSKDFLLESLKVKHQTLLNLLNLGVRFGFWRRFSIGNGFIKFSLRSPQKIARNYLGLEEAGNYCSITVQDFNQINVYTTEMVAISWQERSYHAAKIELSQSKRKVIRPGSLIFWKKPQRRQAPGKPRHLSSRYVGLDDQIAPYGVSNKKVAQLRGLSESTVRNHLNNKWREKQGIYELPKRQLAKLTDLRADVVRLAKDNFDEVKGMSPNMFFVAGEDVYLKSNCIYCDVVGWNSKRPRNYDDKDQRCKFKNAQASPYESVTPPSTPSEGEGDGDDRPARPLPEVLFQWERLKGVSHKSHHFEQLPPRQREAFLKSGDAYPFVNKKGELVKPSISEQPVNNEISIDLLQFAEAVKEEFVSSGSGFVSSGSGDGGDDGKTTEESE